MLASPGVEVNQLHDKFYRKYEVYSMEWSKQRPSVDLSTMMIAGAPSGGPIGLECIFVLNSTLCGYPDPWRCDLQP